MKRIPAAVCSLLLVLIIGCGTEKEKENIYRNRDFGFSITYPADYRIEPTHWVREETGANFKIKNEVMTVQAMPAGTDYAGMPFDRYVRIAAASEIQNYNRLVSIDAFSSDYGINGYRTFWEVINHEDTDNGPVDTTTVIGPIYYFPPRTEQKLGAQPVKTIMISFYARSGDDRRLKMDTEAVAKSFRYLNSVQSLFNKGHHGKISFVKKGEPFRIELPSNPTTGFNWFITDMDEASFRVASSGYEPGATGLVGVGGTSYFEIVPQKFGLQHIGLMYYRVWEGKDKAVDEYRLTVMVI